MNSDNGETVLMRDAWSPARVEELVNGPVEKKTNRKKAEAAEHSRGVYFRWSPNGKVVGPKHVCAERGCHSGNGKPCLACAKMVMAPDPIPCRRKGCVLDGLNRGEWYVLYYDENRKRQQRHAGSKAAAIALYRKLKADAYKGRDFPERKRARQAITLKELCGDYVATLKANGRDAREQAETRLGEVVSVLGDISAKTIQPQDLERLKMRLSETVAKGRKDPTDPKKERTRTAASVNRYLQDLRAAFNVAKRNGKIDRNPVADIRLLRENNKRVREMTADEEKAILTALDPLQRLTKAGRQDRRYHTDLRPLVRFLVATGLRAGEACNLLWPDVDWTAEVVTLRKTKAGKMQHVPLSAEAVAILRALAPEPQGDGYVFGWPDRSPFAVGYLTHAFRKAAIKAGVSNLHVHDLRHTFACRLLRGGVDIYAVSKLLRHASVVMSERYAHLSLDDLRGAVARATATPSGGPTATPAATRPEGQ
jgi:integrase